MVEISKDELKGIVTELVQSRTGYEGGRSGEFTVEAREDGEGHVLSGSESTEWTRKIARIAQRTANELLEDKSPDQLTSEVEVREIYGRSLEVAVERAKSQIALPDDHFNSEVVGETLASTLSEGMEKILLEQGKRSIETKQTEDGRQIAYTKTPKLTENEVLGIYSNVVDSVFEERYG